jgi:hypothetical protein
MQTNLHLSHLIRKTAAVALCALALSPAALFAGDAPKSAEAHGLIKSVDNNAHQLVVTDPKTKADGTFKWNDQTKFTEQAKTVSASALKAGLPVHLTYTTSSGASLLERVKISTGKVPQPAGAPASHPKN